MSRWQLGDGWSVLAGGQYLYNQVSYDASSTLAMDIPSVAPHSVLRAQTGLAYDTRDNEVSPRSGTYDTFEFRESPQIGSAFPYAYQQYDLALRAFVPLSDGNVLAMRVVGDVMVGDVPFYELSRYDDTSAIGGSNGVRGVPAYTFYGKVKLFGNLELRTHVTNFNVWLATCSSASRRSSTQAACGRALDQSRPDLDGTGVGLHWGAGGGLRLQQGRAFLVRADVGVVAGCAPGGRLSAGRPHLLGGHVRGHGVEQRLEPGVAIDVAVHQVAVAAAEAAHDTARTGLRLVRLVHDGLDPRVAGIELGDHRVDLDVVEDLVEREVVIAEHDVPARRDVERHRAPLAVVVADDEHAHAAAGLVERAGRAGGAHHESLPLRRWSISSMPSAGSLPFSSRTMSPITSMTEPARGSVRASETRVPTGSQAAVSRQTPISETSRVRHTTTSPPSSGDTVAASNPVPRSST